MILTTLKLLGTRTGKGFAILVLAGLGITASSITPAQALDSSGVTSFDFSALADEGGTPDPININFTDPNGDVLEASVSILANGSVDTNISGQILVNDPSLPGSPISISVNAQSISVSTAATSVPFEIPGGATIPALGSVISLGIFGRIRKFASQKIFTTN